MKVKLSFEACLSVRRLAGRSVGFSKRAGSLNSNAPIGAFVCFSDSVKEKRWQRESPEINSALIKKNPVQDVPGPICHYAILTYMSGSGKNIWSPCKVLLFRLPRLVFLMAPCIRLKSARAIRCSHLIVQNRQNINS